MKRQLLLPFALVAAGCGSTGSPAGQYLIYVNTDAPLPSAGQVVGPMDPIPLFDAVRIDVYPSGSTVPCAGCSRTFGIDAEAVKNGGVSLGVLPENPQRGAVARVRMYLTEVEHGPEPSEPGSIDVWAALPPIAADGVVERTIVLPADATGIPRGSLSDPVEAAVGPPDPHLVGSWPYAQRVDCADPPGPNEACVPGGAFWMGHPKFAIAAAGPGTESDMRRLVVLSPFYVDLTEVTVAEFRASGLAQPPVFDGEGNLLLDESGTVMDYGDPIPWSGVVPVLPPHIENIAPVCTYSSQEVRVQEAGGSRDELPVNCVSKSLAEAYCAARGASLPTEAQLAYLLGGAAGMVAPWGRSEPSCEDAVYGRAWNGLGFGYGGCRPPYDPPAPLPSGAGARDRVMLGEREVLDLAGNVAEWAQDAWNRQDEPCWGAGVFHNPLCTTESPADGPADVARGGTWSWHTMYLHAGFRYPVAPSYNPDQRDTARDWDIGFRCARAATALSPR